MFDRSIIRMNDPFPSQPNSISPELQERIVELEAKPLDLLKRTYDLNDQHFRAFDTFTKEMGQKGCHEEYPYRGMGAPPFTTPITADNIEKCEEQQKFFERQFLYWSYNRAYIQKMMVASVSGKPELYWEMFDLAKEAGWYEGREPESYLEMRWILDVIDNEQLFRIERGLVRLHLEVALPRPIVETALLWFGPRCFNIYSLLRLFLSTASFHQPVPPHLNITAACHQSTKTPPIVPSMTANLQQMIRPAPYSGDSMPSLKARYERLKARQALLVGRVTTFNQRSLCTYTDIENAQLAERVGTELRPFAPLSIPTFKTISILTREALELEEQYLAEDEAYFAAWRKDKLFTEKLIAISLFVTNGTMMKGGTEEEVKTLLDGLNAAMRDAFKFAASEGIYNGPIPRAFDDALLLLQSLDTGSS
ncbi:hypothetical protein BJ508DRAFT_313540 [Ascobolus immersus RN42]|uniref:Uncharacterized protein n=1 Tax=Ascobolus immersus RN42 TaxID=1160509 RepID=A0A3N4HNM1_ASCIM|nr:hypothetical protein BJ508DRAFT_313540 [Ascobolus immersus RN42]